MCLQALRGARQTPPCEITHMDFSMFAQKHAEKCKRCKVVYNEHLFWSGDFQNEHFRHVFVLPHLISAPFIPNSDYLGVSTSKLIGE